MATYRDLLAWQVSMDLAVTLYEVTRSFPSDEKFAIVAQIRRAAISVPSNIAEGYGRRTRGEYLNALSVAMGSQLELETLLIASNRLGYLGSESEIRECERSGKLLTALARSLRVGQKG